MKHLKSEENRKVLPEPWTNITIDFEAIIRAFQDVRYVGELRQRWIEIKKLKGNTVEIPILKLCI
jgi:hypothetical protein